MKRLNKLATKWLQSAVIIIAALVLVGCGSSSLSYEPWTDLSNHFNLDAIEASGYQARFNSYDISQGREPYVSQLLDDREYFVTVLGTNVVLRSQPKVSAATKIGTVNTGDVLTTRGSSVYFNDKYWNYVYVSSGRSAGRYGYVCTDYIIEQEKYKVVREYVFTSRSNMSIKTESKYLNAIGDILLKLNVNRYHPNLLVELHDTARWHQHDIVTFRITDINSRQNNSLLAVVQFTQGTNDYVVLGVVPGSHIYDVSPMPNGSYDIHFSIE